MVIDITLTYCDNRFAINTCSKSLCVILKTNTIFKIKKKWLNYHLKNSKNDLKK